MILYISAIFILRQQYFQKLNRFVNGGRFGVLLFQLFNRMIYNSIYYIYIWSLQSFGISLAIIIIFNTLITYV